MEKIVNSRLRKRLNTCEDHNLRYITNKNKWGEAIAYIIETIIQKIDHRFDELEDRIKKLEEKL